MRAPIGKIVMTDRQIERLSGRRIARHLKAIRGGDEVALDVWMTEGDQFVVRSGSENRLMASIFAGLRHVTVNVGR